MCKYLCRSWLLFPFGVRKKKNTKIDKRVDLKQPPRFYEKEREERERVSKGESERKKTLL